MPVYRLLGRAAAFFALHRCAKNTAFSGCQRDFFDSLKNGGGITRRRFCLFAAASLRRFFTAS